MTKYSGIGDAVEKSDAGTTGAYNGEGVVHGHIHNYDNMTYIHGHVHHGHHDDSETAAVVPPVQTVEENPGWAVSSPVVVGGEDFCHKYADCQHFEFVNYHTKNMADVHSSNGKIAPTGADAVNTSSTQESSISSETGEFCETSSALVGNTQSVEGTSKLRGSDSMLLPMKNKRSFSDVISNETDEVGADCRCNPKVLEVCCDMDHVPSSVSTEEGLLHPVPPINDNDIVVCAGVKNDFLFPAAANEYDFKNELPGINCDLTCVCPSDELHTKTANVENEEGEVKESEDDIFEKFCRECISLNQEHAQDHDHEDVHRPRHCVGGCNTDNTSATPSSTPSSSSESLQKELPVSGEEKIHFASNRTSACHDHVVNSQMDLRILDDLCGISSLYELPFASHMNHHNHAHDHHRGHDNQGVNLLQSSIGGRVNGSGPRNDSAPHNHHHHHRIHFHQHPQKEDKSAALDTNGSILWDQSQNSQNVPDKLKTEECASVLHHHSSNPLNFNNFGVEANTINFNWSFKNEMSGELKCEWDRCFEQFPSLIDLQKHMFRDHVSQENSASNHLCNWNNCQFKGEDICSLVNHINSDHGINFGMKVLDPASLLEQREQHHSLHCSDQQCQVGKLQCQWSDCAQLFATAEELSNHLEKFHLPRGQSEYKCYWRGCSRKFTQRQKMVRHLKVHSGYKPFKCGVCLKFFSSEDTLNQHMRTHSGEKPFQCHLCGKRFSVSSSLKIHIRTHTGEKPLQCKVCGKRFNESSNLNKHLKTHRKKFKCSTCPKNFDTLEKAKNHEVICLRSRR